jgi:hypothetical protein
MLTEAARFSRPQENVIRLLVLQNQVAAKLTQNLSTVDVHVIGV